MKVLPYRIERFNTDRTSIRASLSISVYQKFDFFEKVAASLEQQTYRDFEIIVCDDGSDETNSQRFQEILKNLPFPSLYVWHSDQGFYKNEILNKGILNARSEYMIFIDGDCVLHPKFIEDHLALKEPRTILAGRRTNLTSWVSNLLSLSRIREGFLQQNFWWIFPIIAWEKHNNAPKGVRFASDSIFSLLNRSPRGVVGSNFSVHRKDLLEVNGFDIRYHAPGTGEDSDIEWRLQQAGLQTKPICHRAIQYHLWHKLQNRNPETEKLFEEVRKVHAVRTQFGIEQIASQQ